VSVQLCDVRGEPMEPLRAESLGHRLPPGRGYGDTVGLVRALAAPGVTPAVMTVEVISHELIARGVDVATQVAADAAREVLARAAIA
jgi:sugar phosphate isomerase/epimerase